MKSFVQSSTAIALTVLLGSAASHAAATSLVASSRGAPLDNRSVGPLFSPDTDTPAAASAAVTSFGSVVSGPLEVGTAAESNASATLYLPFATVAADGVEPRSFTSGTLAAGLYTLLASGIGNASTSTYLEGNLVAAAATPQAYALLLAGLLAIGFILRRRFD